MNNDILNRCVCVRAHHGGARRGEIFEFKGSKMAVNGFSAVYNVEIYNEYNLVHPKNTINRSYGLYIFHHDWKEF